MVGAHQKSTTRMKGKRVSIRLVFANEVEAPFGNERKVSRFRNPTLSTLTRPRHFESGTKTRYEKRDLEIVDQPSGCRVPQPHHLIALRLDELPVATKAGFLHTDSLRLKVDSDSRKTAHLRFQTSRGRVPQLCRRLFPIDVGQHCLLIGTKLANTLTGTFNAREMIRYRGIFFTRQTVSVAEFRPVPASHKSNRTVLAAGRNLTAVCAERFGSDVFIVPG